MFVGVGPYMFITFTEIRIRGTVVFKVFVSYLDSNGNNIGVYVCDMTIRFDTAEIFTVSAAMSEVDIQNMSDLSEKYAGYTIFVSYKINHESDKCYIVYDSSLIDVMSQKFEFKKWNTK